MYTETRNLPKRMSTTIRLAYRPVAPHFRSVGHTTPAWWSHVFTILAFADNRRHFRWLRAMWRRESHRFAWLWGVLDPTPILTGPAEAAMSHQTLSRKGNNCWRSLTYSFTSRNFPVRNLHEATQERQKERWHLDARTDGRLSSAGDTQASNNDTLIGRLSE
jgi:hypothetical protein